jgi:hypothetical protein
MCRENRVSRSILVSLQKVTWKKTCARYNNYISTDVIFFFFYPNSLVRLCSFEQCLTGDSLMHSRPRRDSRWERADGRLCMVTQGHKRCRWIYVDAACAPTCPPEYNVVSARKDASSSSSRVPSLFTFLVCGREREQLPVLVELLLLDRSWQHTYASSKKKEDGQVWVPPPAAISNRVCSLLCGIMCVGVCVLYTV